MLRRSKKTEGLYPLTGYSVYAVFQYLRPLPFWGGAAAAAEGVVIYRLPYRAALSVRKSLRAVRIAERNRYTENTPLGTPSGTARERKRLFFWLQKKRGKLWKTYAEDSVEKENGFSFGYKRAG